MTVIRPNSISGITSLTAHRGSIDFYAHDGSAARFDNINSNVTSGVSTFASLNITGDLDVGGALTYEDVTNVDSIGVVTARNGLHVTGGRVGIGTDVPEDELHLFLSSSSDGPSLRLTNPNGGDGTYTGRISTGDAAGTFFSGINFLKHDSNDGEIRLRTKVNGSNTDVVTIVDGNVGINEDNPQNSIHISGSAPAIRFVDSGANGSAFSIIEDNNGLLKIRNDAGNSGTGSGIAFEVDAGEKLRITSDGYARLTTANARLEWTASSGSNPFIRSIGSGQQELEFNTGGTERLRISSNGTTTVGPQYDQVKIEPGNGTYDAEATTLSVDGRTNDGNRVALKVDRYLSGTTATTKFSVKYDGSIFSTSGVQASSVNLQNSNTNSWFQTGANYGGTNYVWAAKDSSANVWHSGLQTDGDLLLGGNINGTSNIKLNGSNGSATFTGQITANPLYLTNTNSWIKSGYGAISNGTVSSLNNLLIGQNMRGYISGIDGGSVNNNFYNIATYGTGGMGHAGTEYCYGGVTKFYNSTAATTANATFTPNETVRFDTSGLTVNNGLRISTTSGGNTLPNPYSIGLITTATIPSYPHFTGIWVVTGSIPCNNTWYDLLHSINDSNGLFHGYSGDASSKNIFQYQYSLTSPAYGVNILSQRFMNGAWNTGSVSFQLRNNGGPWTLQMKATSHYNSNNNAGFRIMFHSYY